MGRRIIVTGGGTGLGLAIARRLCVTTYSCDLADADRVGELAAELTAGQIGVNGGVILGH